MRCRTLSRFEAARAKVELAIIKQGQFNLPTEIFSIRPVKD
jgi:hypothetical protein